MLFPSPGYLPDPGSEFRSPALQADYLQAELPGNKHWAGGGCSQGTLPADLVAQSQTGTWEVSPVPHEHLPTGLRTGFHFGPQTLACHHPKLLAHPPWLTIPQGHPSAHAGHLPVPHFLQQLISMSPGASQSQVGPRVSRDIPGLPEAILIPGQGLAHTLLHTHCQAVCRPLLTHQPGKPDFSLLLTPKPVLQV